MNMDESLSRTPEYSKAFNQFEVLRESLLKVQEEKEHLISQVLPELEALYLSKVGKLKLELLEVSIEVHRLKRKMEMIQSCLNRQSEIVIEAIEVLLEEEILQQKKKLEEESKKLEAALRYITIKPMNNEEADELKKIYYRLARILHPDLNPVQNDSMKLLWLKVSECYRRGDLEEMKLLEILAEHNEVVDSTPTVLEELKRRNEVISKQILKLISEIDKIKSSFPFTYIGQLNDAGWVEEENNQSLIAIAKLRDEKAMYERTIELLLKEAGA